MNLRIEKSMFPSVFGGFGYWVEKMDDSGFWRMVDGTIANSASEAWEAYEIQQANQEAIVTQAERKMLMDKRFAFCGDSERVVWSEIERQSKLAVVEENYFATGSDLA
jgi:hypothetical protein